MRVSHIIQRLKARAAGVMSPPLRRPDFFCGDCEHCNRCDLPRSENGAIRMSKRQRATPSPWWPQAPMRNEAYLLAALLR